MRSENLSGDQREDIVKDIRDIEDRYEELKSTSNKEVKKYDVPPSFYCVLRYQARSGRTQFFKARTEEFYKKPSSRNRHGTLDLLELVSDASTFP